MITRPTRFFFLFPLAVVMLSLPAHGGEKESVAIEPKADVALQQMSDYLDSLQQFSIHIENTADVLLESGHTIQLGDAAEVTVHRPNRLRGDVEGDARQQQLFYDGKQITLFDRKENYYATAEAPPSIYEAINFARETIGLVAPAADLVAGNAYQILAESVNAGFYLGLHRVLGVECHHLLFVQDELDWQILIENSKTPLPRKLLITEKLTKERLRFTSLFSDWNLSPRFKEEHFTFVPSGTAQKIEFLPLEKAIGIKN